MLHLAIFSPGFIEKIFSGRKTMESRFSVIRCLPYKGIEKGDLIFMKRSGGPILGYFLAGTVHFYKDLTPQKLERIVKKYWYELALSESFWESKKNSKYLTLIKMKKPTPFRLPVTVKKSSLHGWIALGGESKSQISLF